MTQAVAKPASTALASIPAPPTQEILSTDIVIPRLLLMQGLSEFVVEGLGRQGEILRSSTKEKIAGLQAPGEPFKTVNFIPLKVTMDWAEKEKIGQKFEFRRSLPRTFANENSPWSFWRNPQGVESDKPGLMGATEWQRVKGINVFALLPTDVDAFTAEMAKATYDGEMPDLTKTVLPVVISFRSTSFNAGKSVTTFFAQVAEMARSVPAIRSYKYCMSLGCKADKNEKGAFYIFDVGQPQKLAQSYHAQAERWFNLLNSLKDVKIDSSGESEAVQEGASY